MEITGSGLGKIILYGEHAAVSGFPAVGITLPLRVTATIRHSSEKGWDLVGVPRKFEEDVLQVVHIIQEKVKALPSGGHIVPEGGEIVLASTLPVSAGFGSSAALSVALAEAFLGYTKAEKSDADLVWHTAHSAERYFHGSPSGIDTGLACREGISAFYPSGPGLPLRVPLKPFPVPLVVGALSRSGKARTLIRRLKEGFESGDSHTEYHIRKLGSIAEEAISMLKSRVQADTDEYTRLTKDAHSSLQSLGLSTPELDRVLLKGEELGGLAGKVSGAGAGGAFFLLAGSNEQASYIAEELKYFAEEEGISFLFDPVPLSYNPARTGSRAREKRVSTRRAGLPTAASSSSS